MHTSAVPHWKQHSVVTSKQLMSACQRYRLMLCWPFYQYSHRCAQLPVLTKPGDWLDRTMSEMTYLCRSGASGCETFINHQSMWSHAVAMCWHFRLTGIPKCQNHWNVLWSIIYISGFPRYDESPSIFLVVLLTDKVQADKHRSLSCISAT